MGRGGGPALLVVVVALRPVDRDPHRATTNWYHLLVILLTASVQSTAVTFTEDIDDETDDFWSAIVAHLMVEALGDGTLEPAPFRYWVRQDYVYLIEYSRVFAYGAATAPSLDELRTFADLLAAAVGFPLVYGLFSRSLTGRGALASSVAGLAVGLAYFPDLRGYITAVPVVGDALPAADPLYLTSFAGAFLVSTALTLAAARVSDATVDLDALADRVTRLDDVATDGGTSCTELVDDTDR